MPATCNLSFGAGPNASPPFVLVPLAYLALAAYCFACKSNIFEEDILLCDGCDVEYHRRCLTVPLSTTPEGEWYCVDCMADKLFGDNLETFFEPLSASNASKIASDKQAEQPAAAGLPHAASGGSTPRYRIHAALDAVAASERAADDASWHSFSQTLDKPYWGSGLHGDSTRGALSQTAVQPADGSASSVAAG